MIQLFQINQCYFDLKYTIHIYYSHVKIQTMFMNTLGTFVLYLPLHFSFTVQNTIPFIPYILVVFIYTCIKTKPR